jgi:hypothetical protein
MVKKSNELKTEKNNPFLTEKADKLWERLDKQGKSISKEELVKRANILKAKAHS